MVSIDFSKGAKFYFQDALSPLLQYSKHRKHRESRNFSPRVSAAVSSIRTGTTTTLDWRGSRQLFDLCMLLLREPLNSSFAHTLRFASDPYHKYITVCKHLLDNCYLCPASAPHDSRRSSQLYLPKRSCVNSFLVKHNLLHWHRPIGARTAV